jgi:hypothetical protein
MIVGVGVWGAGSGCESNMFRKQFEDFIAMTAMMFTTYICLD